MAVGLEKKSKINKRMVYVNIPDYRVISLTNLFEFPTIT